MNVVLAKWFRNIDVMAFVLTLMLMIIGVVLIGTASPAMSYRIGTTNLHFFFKQIIFLAAAIPILFLVPIFSTKQLKNLMQICFIVTILMLIILPFFGEETKGAIRWIKIYSFSLQPSEFLKPSYAVIVAAILDRYHDSHLKAIATIGVFHISILSLLLTQPDFGMAMTISVVTFMQMFIANMPLWIMFGMIMCGCGLIYCAYIWIPHVNDRITNFLSGDATNLYQISKSLEAHNVGGLFGKGVGEGSLKYLLPDSHADFIFAVANEEFGIIFGCLLIFIFALLILYCLYNIIKNIQISFNIYAGFGAMFYIALQSIANIAVTLNLIPTKGVTLPFISYGGCSLISMSLCVAVYLSATSVSNNRLLNHHAMHIRY